MTDPDLFDSFYRDVRTRLLLLTYGLTGDLPSSRAAVRDAFVVTWHHWRKVSRLEDPEGWVRERACRRAQRRHTAKLWHREKGLDPEIKSTLDALGKLSMQQRRVLLVTELTSASIGEMAREVGLPRTDAERELQTASSQFSLHREVPTTGIRSTLLAMAPHVESARLPRATIIRRAGATRRRTHTVLGVAATAAALVISGTVVTHGDGVRPTLAGERVESKGPSPSASAEPAPLPATAMLDASAVSRRVDGRDWKVASTDDNTGGSGMVMPCQLERYAGARPQAALARTLDARPHDASAASLVQLTEAQRSTRAALRAYDSSVDWFAGCTSDRAQLMATYRLPGVGDQAMLFVLRTWQRPDTTVLAAVGRTGQLTTSVVSRTRGANGPEPRAVAGLLADGVNRLCSLPDGGTCAKRSVRVQATTPVPAAEVPSMLDVVDLPPVSGVTEPWVATPAQQARKNLAATYCDSTAFTGAQVSRATTGSFLILNAKLPDAFGLTETQGALPLPAARALVSKVRTDLERCEDKDLGATVRRSADLRTADRDLTVWHLTTELSDDQKMAVSMAILRSGTSVAQLGFVPAGGARMSDAAFEAVARRALERLDELPAPQR